MRLHIVPSQTFVRSLLQASMRELTRYETTHDETYRVQAAEKVWMATHKLIEIMEGRNVPTGHINEAIR